MYGRDMMDRFEDDDEVSSTADEFFRKAGAGVFKKTGVFSQTVVQ
jgi:hypothetical protein